MIFKDIIKYAASNPKYTTLSIKSLATVFVEHEVCLSILQKAGFKHACDEIKGFNDEDKLLYYGMTSFIGEKVHASDASKWKSESDNLSVDLQEAK